MVQALKHNLISSTVRGCLWIQESRALKDRIEEGEQPELKQGCREAQKDVCFGEGAIKS